MDPLYEHNSGNNYDGGEMAEIIGVNSYQNWQNSQLVMCAIICSKGKPQEEQTVIVHHPLLHHHMLDLTEYINGLVIYLKGINFKMSYLIAH